VEVLGKRRRPLALAVKCCLVAIVERALQSPACVSLCRHLMVRSGLLKTRTFSPRIHAYAKVCARVQSERWFGTSRCFPLPKK
jgi:hypothetical protein